MMSEFSQVVREAEPNHATLGEPPVRPSLVDSGRWRSFDTSQISGSAAALLCSACALAVAWPIFVFTGAQPAFALATAASCAIAALLALRRTSVVLAYLVGVIAVIGPDANGPLGAGQPWLGSLRILDVSVVGAALGTAWAIRRSGLLRLRAPEAGWPHALAAVAILYAAARWLQVGHRVGSLLRTDLRLIAIGVLVAFVAWRGVRGSMRPLLNGVAVIGLLAALKAIAIHLSGVMAIGEYDRLQAASFVSAGHVRTILIGGDTMLVLTPATALLLSLGARRPWKVFLATVAVASLAALSLSDTRTSVLVAVGLALLVGVAAAVAHGVALRPHVLLGAVLGALVVGCVIVVSGVGARLTHADAPHVGLNFRADEVHSFLHLSSSAKLLGQGLGGSFVSKGFNGHPVVAGWAHELPVFLALKDGLLGLAAATAAFVLILKRAFRRWRQEPTSVAVLAGSGYVLALVLMSMTIDRVALVEGLVALIVAVRLLSGPVAEEVR